MTPTEWQIFFLSMLPVTELRAAIPLGLALGVTPLKTYLLAVTGNIVPIVPVLLLLDPASAVLRMFPAVDEVFQKILIRTRRKGKEVQKYGPIGLLLFVAVPLPGTGAWTALLIAWLLGIGLIPAAAAITGGVIIAGTVVTLVCLGFIQMTLVYDLEYIALFLLLVIAAYAVYRKKRK